jgi:hypothetical protein
MVGAAIGSVLAVVSSQLRLTASAVGLALDAPDTAVALVFAIADPWCRASDLDG